MEKHITFGGKIPLHIFEMLQLVSIEHLHAVVVYHFDMLASSFSKSQIYIYSNVFIAVKVDTA